MPTRTPKSRLVMLLRRLDQWETDTQDGDTHPAVAEELLLDIKQCLESVLENWTYEGS